MHCAINLMKACLKQFYSQGVKIEYTKPEESVVYYTAQEPVVITALLKILKTSATEVTHNNTIQKLPELFLPLTEELKDCKTPNNDNSKISSEQPSLKVKYHTTDSK